MYARNIFKVSNNSYNFEFQPFLEMARANFQTFHEVAGLLWQFREMAEIVS